MQLNPATYSCTRHGTVDLTDLVRAELEGQGPVFDYTVPGRARGRPRPQRFTVLVTCPGNDSHKEHQVRLSGKYTV